MITYVPQYTTTKLFKDFEEIQITDIKNQILISSNNIFNIFEANYLKIEKPVYILQLKFLDPPKENEELDMREILLNAESHLTQDNFSDNFLERIGYSYNKKEHIFYLFYLKENYTLFNLEEFLKNVQNRNSRFAKLHLFYQLCQLLKICHRDGFKLGLIHPNLFFYNTKKGFVYIDFILDELIQDVDKIKYFQISNYFGYFDLDVVSEIEQDIFQNELEIEGLYFKTDIILINILLVYLFSTRIQNRKEEYSGITYEKILNQLQRDYFMKNVKFTNFLYTVKDDKVLFNFLIKNINISYIGLPSIDSYFEIFEKFYLNENNIEKCANIECQNEVSSLKKINYICFETLCENCFDSHSCDQIAEKNKESILQQYSAYKMQVDRLKETADEMPNIEEKLLSDYFNYNIQDTFVEIDSEHSKIERIVQIEEEKLNSIIHYVDNLLSEKNTEQKSELLKSLEKFNKELIDITNEIEKINKSDGKKQTKRIFLSKIQFQSKPGLQSLNLQSLGSDQKNHSSNNLTEVDIEAKQETKLEFRRSLKKRNTGVIFDDEKMKNFKTKNEKIDDLLKNGIDYKEAAAGIDLHINKFQDFIDSTQELKNLVNYNMKINYALETLKNKAKNYIEELTSSFENDFENAIKGVSIEICNLFQENYLFKDSNPSYNIFREYSKEFYQNVSCLDHKKEELLLFKCKDNSFKNYKINFPSESKIKEVLKHCRSVNMRTRVVVTGGVRNDSQNNEIPTKYAFFLEYDDEKNQSERQAYMMPDMITDRDQHSIISVNDFYIMCIGGIQTDKCEIFNFLTNKWTEKPSLNQMRYNASSYLHNETDLYIFFGLQGNKNFREKNVKFCTDIERLCIYSDELKWEIISINLDYKIKNSIVEFSCNGIIPSIENDIYIAGGKTAEDFTDKFYKLNLETYKLEIEEKTLSKKLGFYESNFLKLGSHDWGLFTCENILLKFKF